jgi:hypothetical protein
VRGGSKPQNNALKLTSGRWLESARLQLNAVFGRQERDRA